MNATKTQNPRWGIAVNALLALTLVLPATSFAASATWVGNTDANWNTAGNWSLNAVPVNGDSLVFGGAGSAGAALNNNLSGLTVNNLTFNGGASSFTIGGNGLTLGTGGIDASAMTSGTETISGTVTLATGLQKWNVGTGATLSLGSIGAAGGDAADLYTGTGAMVIISKTGTIKTTTADGWGWRSGAVSGTGVLGPGMVIDNGDNTYDFASVGNQTAGTSRAIVAPTYTTVPGSGDAHNVMVVGNATYTGGNASWVSILVNNATLTINPTVYVDTGVILENGGIISGGTLNANQDGHYIYVPNSGTISSKMQNGAKKLYKAGPGTLTLNAAVNNNNYTGGTLVYQGALNLANGGQQGEIRGTLTIYPGATVNLNAGDALGWDTVASGTTIPTVNIVGGTVNNGISGNQGFNTTFNLTGGTMTNSAANTGSQGYNFNGSSGAINSLAANIVSTIYSPVVLRGNGLTINTAQGAVPSGIDLNITGPIIANGGDSWTKAGAGTLQLSGANTFAGTLTINAGKLQLGGGSLANTAIALSGTGTFAVKPGSSTTINAGTTGAGTAGATLNLGGLTFDMGDSATSTFNLQQNTSFASTALTIANGATLKFDLGGSTTAADLLAVSKAASVSGTVNVTVNTIGSTALSAGTYNIITAASGLNGGTWQFIGGGTKQTVTLGGTRSNIRLNNSITAVSLTVANAYTVTYNGNGSDGGIVPTDSNSPYDSGASVTVVSAGTMTKSGYTFTGWNTQANGSGTAYSPGGTFNISSDTTLYAQWTLASATITAPSTFPGAVSTTYGTASSPQSVSISGANLTANITATATTSGLQISSDGVNYGTTATFTQSGGSASGTLYVRLATNAPVSGSYNSQLVSLTSTAAPTVNVATTASGNAVAAKTLTVTGAVAQDKLYDGSNAAVITGGTLVGVVGGDNVTLNLSGTFPSSAAGGPYTVTSTSTLGGTAAGNYTLTQPTGLTATIFASAVWNGGGGDANWSTSLNWANGLAPGLTGNPVSFAGSTQTSPNMDNNYSVTGVTFDSGAASFTIGTASSTLTLTGSGVTNNSANAQTLNVPISMSGAQTFNAAAGDLTFGQNVANGVNAITLTGASNTVINGAISGSGTITKTGSGTAALNGSVASGSVTVSAGKLNLGGSYTSGNANNPAIASGAVLEISGGTLTGTAGSQVYDSSLNVGTTSGYVSGLRMSAGSLPLSKQLALANSGGFGGFYQSGGTATLGGFLAMGLGNGVGILNQSGGTFTVSTAPVTCGAGGSSYGCINLGGTAVFNVNGSGDNGLWLGESGAGSLNISAGAALNFATANNGLQLGRNGSGSGVVNLLGGTVTTKAVYKGSGTGTLNFNGGTLKANQANTSFLTGLTAAYVHGGGAVINDGGFAVTVGQALLTPSGSGVTSIPVTAGGSGYIESPQVTISGGGGSGATATAQINYTTGAITNILVTSPGNDYTSAPTVTLTGGGGSGATIGTPTIGANTSGGLTKLGAGTLTLSGTSTYTGNTVISNGTLRVNGVLGNTAVAVKTGATLGGNGTIGGVVTVNSGGTLSPGTSIATLTLGSITLNSGATAAMELGDSLTADKAAASGAVVYGGTLKLIWAGTTPATGTVDLFDGSSFSGAFSSLQFSNWPSAYRVTTNNLTTDGSIIIAANNAPVAQNLTAGVVQGGTTTLQIIGGKHSATDADGDSISVTAVGTPTSGSASFTSGSVSYIASGSTGTHTFTYTVTDSFGASDTKTVTVVVTDPQGFNLVSAGVSGGNAVLAYLGIPGMNYALEITHTLPATNWAPVITNPASANGSLNFTNPISLSPTNDYYRTRYVP